MYVMYVRNDVRKVGIAKVTLGQGLLGVVSTLLHCGILAIIETRRLKFGQKQTFVGPSTF